MEKVLEPNLSLLMMSLASSALTALGHDSHPSIPKEMIDKPMARFNIDLFILLKEKTKNNLTIEETKLIDQLIYDLQIKFIEAK